MSGMSLLEMPPSENADVEMSVTSHGSSLSVTGSGKRKRHGEKKRDEAGI